MAEETTPALPPPKKRSIGKIILVVAIAIIALVLLAGGGFYFYKFRNKTPEFHAHTVITGFLYARDTTEDKKKVESFFNSPSIILPKIQIPIMKDHGVVATLKFRVTVKAKSDPIFEEIKFKLPYIMDAIFVQIFTLYSNLWTPSIAPDQEILKKYVLKAIESALGANKIESLYIKNFSIEK